jgi:1,4-dihydroxy-2-naphthoate octaprenyltransferase
MTSQLLPTPGSKLGIWYRAARPRTLTATYVPLGASAMIAIQQGIFNLLLFVLSLIAALLLQIAANLINEYVDFRRGAEDQKLSGQGMILKAGLLSPREVLAAAIVSLVGGCLIGLFLLTQSGPLLLLIGVLGVLVVISYTAGPFALAYNGLGEIAVFIFMGPLMVLGAYFVMAARFDWTPIWVGIPIGLMVAAILHANNVRDIESDRAVNKRTLAVLLGLRAARIEFALLVVGAYGALVILALASIVPITSLLAFVTAPEAFRLIEMVRTSSDNALLHQAQGRTAQLHGQFGMFMIIGWGVGLALIAVGALR